jgi:hypothetical protein
MEMPAAPHFNDVKYIFIMAKFLIVNLIDCFFPFLELVILHRHPDINIAGYGGGILLVIIIIMGSRPWISGSLTGLPHD